MQRLRRAALAAALTLACAGPLVAQEEPPRTTRPPVLLTRTGTDWKPIDLASVDVDVTLVGTLARTRMTMVFANPNARVLEGELVFPLPEGSTVSGYGIDVEGVVVGAVAIERQRARVAFETEVRKGVDPGLVEWTRGNNFRTRIYPLPAKGQRTVRVEYISDLAGKTPIYRLPLSFHQKVGTFRLAVQVQGGAMPISGGPLTLAWANENGILSARATKAEFSSDQPLELTLAAPPVRAAHVEAVTERGKPVHYVQVSHVPGPPAKAGPAQAAPKRIGLLWDASLSQSRADRSKTIAVLRALLSRLGSVGVEVIRFRDTAEPGRTFRVEGGACDALFTYLEKTRYDGGTDLGQLSVSTRCDWWVLAGDGLGTLGQELPAKLDAPLFVLSADPHADHGLLRTIARRSGGRYFNLASVSVADAAGDIGRRGLLDLVRIEADPAQIDQLVPAGRQPVSGRVVVAGRLKADRATLTLVYSDGRKEAFEVTRAQARPSGLIARAWATRQAAELMLRPDRNRAALIKLGKRFGLVTPHTSLLVLESLAQHLEHHVLPPRSRPKLRQKYLEQIERQTVAQAKARQSKLAQVQAMWNRRIAWYDTTFTYPADFRWGGSKDKKSDARRGGGAPGGRPARSPGPGGADEGSGSSGGGGGLRRAERSRSLNDAAPKKNGESAPSGPKITIKPWDPKTPYMARLKDAGTDEAYDVYLEQRAQYAGSPAYYLDCAEFFVARKRPALALRILTGILELAIEDAALLRVVAHRLEQLGQFDRAIGLFERVRRLRPEEPQSHRDLALVLGRRGDVRASKDQGGAMDDYERAIDLLAQVVKGNWHGRFPEIEVIALTEANRLLASLQRFPMGGERAWKNPLDPSLVKATPVDIRILLTWDADATDIDLWVSEPSGEKCLYSHPRTTIGGLMTKDFTQGYGPEVYLIKKAMPGKYVIQCNFYGSRQQKLTGGTTIQATVITHFGRPNETRQALTVRLSKKKDVVDLGSIVFGK